MDSIATPKSKKKNKLFPCFRAAASGGGHVRTVRSKDDPEDVFPFITVDENVRPLYGGDVDTGHRKMKGSAGAFSRALKAVLFGTSLAKKIRKRKAKEKQNSKDEINQRHQAPSSIGNNRSRTASDNLNYHNSSTCSSRTSAPFSSSSFCSSSPASSEMSEISFRFYPNGSNRLLRQINLRKIFSGWFVLLVCLLSLVLWGKLGAIICTSVWILCLYRRRMGFGSAYNKGSAVAMSSGEYYKRRIAMEGFLKRERSGAQNSILRID